MRADPKTYEDVAKNCSQFIPVDGQDTFTNSSTERRGVSCVNCKHFTKDSYCDIDLYDKIIENL